MALVKELLVLSKWYRDGKMSEDQIEEEINTMMKSGSPSNDGIDSLTARFPTPTKVVFDAVFSDGPKRVISFHV